MSEPFALHTHGTRSKAASKLAASAREECYCTSSQMTAVMRHLRLQALLQQPLRKLQQPDSFELAGSV
ncbi:hypothetical protein WJX74_002503 [Apatococcus lobatus]|uniref:Uncharacterized protein n=1 Tax=Apatococcus lobatus TaxID=904363 RepID=A0AAW1RP12_9CHLO